MIPSFKILLPAFILLLPLAAFPVFSLAADEPTDISTADSEIEQAIESENSEAPEQSLPDPAEQERIRQAVLDKDRYEKVIEQLELNAGQDAYSAELSEAYMDLGYVLRTLGQHEDSIEAFDQALQSVRISSGLNSEQQLPILRELLSSYYELESWDAVDANSHLIFHIHRKRFPVGDERRLQALNQLGSWKLAALEDGRIGGFTVNAGEVRDLYRSELRQLQEAEDYPDKNFHLASLYLGQARAYLGITREIVERPLSDYRTSTSQTTVTQRCQLVRTPDGKYVQVCETVEVPNMDFYIDPSNRKNQEISRRLSDIRSSVSRAWEILQAESDVPEKKEILLNELEATTNAYNDFVSKNLQ